MGQNILHFIVCKKPKESKHLTQIPKPHQSTSLRNHRNQMKIVLVYSGVTNSCYCPGL